LKGKVCLVTGATNGIGRAAATRLAALGATMALVGRDPARTLVAVEQIKQETGNLDVTGLLADLSAQADIRRLAQEFRQRFDRLDVLVNNAGAMFMRRAESVDGIEKTFALNHLAYFLLTNLLEDMLVSSAPSRVVVISSIAHRLSSLPWHDLQNKRFYVGWLAYGQSKLANLYFTYELARRLQGTSVTVNALHPGYVMSNLAHGKGWLSAMYNLTRSIGISSEQGAESIVYLASAPELAFVSGQYFNRSKPARSSTTSQNRENAAKLWAISAAMTGLSE